MKQIIIPFGHFLFCLLALFPMTQATGQGFELVFEKGSTVPNIGDPGYDIIESSDGNLLVLTNENGTDGQILKKLDPNGNLLWQQSVGLFPQTFAVALLEMANGNIVVVGDRRVQGQPTQRAFYWQVRNASGTFLSDDTYHDGASHFSCTGAVLANNGQLIMAGFKNFSSTAPEMTLVGASTTGAIFWTESWPSNYKLTKGNVALITNGPFAVAYHDPATDNVAIRAFLLGGNVVTQQVYPQITGGVTDLEAGVGSGLFLGIQTPGNNECIFKFDNNLALLWSALPQGTYGPLNSAVLAPTSDGGCGATGYTGGQFLQLYKMSALGVQEWEVIWENGPFNPGGDGAAIASTSINSFAITGQLFSNNNFVIATDANGQVATHTVTGRIMIDYNDNCQLDAMDFPYMMNVTLSGAQGIYNDQTTNNGLFNFTLETGNYDLIIDAGQGFQLCQTISVDASQANGTTNLGDVLVSPDAFYTISGTVYQNNNASGGCIFNPGEQPMTDRPMLFTIPPNAYFHATTDANGQYSFTVPNGLYFTISTDSVDLCNSCNTLVATASQNLVYDIGVNCLGALGGRVFNDVNLNCLFDPGEQPFVGWQVAAVRQNTTDTIFINTNNAGGFSRYVNTGTHEVFVLPPNNLWASCAGPYLLNVDDSNSAFAEFPMQAQAICPRLRVDVGTNQLRPCMQSNYVVKYCNDGTDAALAAYVEVALDPLLFLTGSQFPATDLGNNTYRFDIADVPLGACGEFWFKANLACWATPGATHCVEAHIFPDSICAPPNPIWDGSNIELSATCENSEVKFTITNTGQGNMSAPITYLVIEDNVLLRPDEAMLFQLEAGGDTMVVFPSNGRTLRLQTQQAPGHPTGTMTAAWVEGCGATGNEPIDISYVTQYPSGDEEYYLAIDCRQNVFSYDPNDKLAFPQGIGHQRFIENTTELDYQIRFQNTGTAPAFEVVLRDTLSPFLDPETLRPGASSHPYDFALENGNVAVFTFSAINLPPLTAGEEASQGWVKFRIAQTPGNQPGTQVENEASIYFDQNPPIVTPIVVHRIPFPETTVYEQATLCEGEAWQGQVFQNDTTLSEVIHYAFFDSVFITEIDVLPSANTAWTQTLCFGESLLLNGTLYDEANPTGTEVFTAANGCDSTVHVSLSFLPAAMYELTETLCHGGSLTVGGTVFNEASPAGSIILTAENGCDSTVHVSLSFDDEVTFLLTRTLCPGENLTVNGTIYDEQNPQGMETFPQGSYLGCDSTVQVILSFYPVAQSSVTGPLCPGESIIVNGTPYDISNATGLEVYANASSTGCDSTVYIDLEFLENSFTTIDTSLLEGGFWGKIPIYSDTSFIMVLPAANGCDSLISVVISVFPNAVSQSSLPIFNLKTHPNPASSFAWASFELPVETALSWHLTNSLGQVLKASNGKTKWLAGRHQLAFDLDGVPNGSYHFWLFGPMGKAAARVVVIH